MFRSSTRLMRTCLRGARRRLAADRLCAQASTHSLLAQGCFAAPAAQSAVRPQAFCAPSASAPESEPAKEQHSSLDAERRQQLLAAALTHVGALGWTEDALRAAAHDLGLSAAAVGLLPRGAAELVDHFTASCDLELASQLQSRKEELAGLRMRQRITRAVRMRLEMNTPFISSWAQALSLQALPGNVATAVRQRAALVDEIWHALGDTSSDVSWYTKRATLAAVFSATEVFMITDLSSGFSETWAFLDRRIADVMEAGKAWGEVSQAAKTFLAGRVRGFD